MAVTEPDEAVLRFTVDDFDAMAEAGLFDDIDGRIELVDGVIYDMSREGPEHSFLASMLARWAIRGLEDDLLSVRVGNPAELSRVSRPAPDLAVVDTAANRPDRFPEGAHFVVEVAKTSLRRGLGIKARVYAEARVTEYWVLDVEHRALHVHTEPRDGAYARVERIALPATVTPASVPLPPLDLGAMLL